MNVNKYISDLKIKSNALKSEILSSPTNISFNLSGIVYYVANDGDDENSGLSQLKPWVSLDKVNTFKFNDRDVVLFKRGDLWRGQLHTKAGVTYSAYGEGEKPKIYGSLKNYTIKDEWEKTDYNNIYVYKYPFELDVGLIVFNHGEKHSIKKIVGSLNFTGELTEMQNDLEMYHCLENKKVYLYSKEGNPAQRFLSIEIAQKKHIITVEGDNVTIDNLCIKYGGAHGIGTSNRNGLTVKFCELGWIGGSLQGINSTTRYGNAIEIYVSCSNFTVDHCYVYQIYDAGLTHQFKDKNDKSVSMMDVCYSNNLIEYCTYSIEYFLGQTDDINQIMKNITIKNNICRFAGFGWGDQRPDKSEACHIKSWDHINPSKDFIIENNIFDQSKYMLIHCGASKDNYLPKIKGNVFIQNKNAQFGRYQKNPTSLILYDESVSDKFLGNMFIFV